MNEFYKLFDSTYYITNNELTTIENNFNNLYKKIKRNKFYIFSKKKRAFIKIFKNRYLLKEKANSIYINKMLHDHSELLNNINGYSLDNEQRRCIVDEEDHLLVIAGAGSGKSLTIIGKIRYLIETKYIEENQLLCISFTNDSTKSLNDSLMKCYNYNLEVLTFHKLALKIIKKVQKEIKIADPNTLEFLIDEFFDSIIFDYQICLKMVVHYFNNTEHNYYNEYKNLISTKKFINFKKLICQFIKLFKANVFNEEILMNYLYKAKYNKKDYCFIFNAIIIYKIYTDELKSQKEFDFDDMILYSINLIDHYQLNLKYKYVIVDEYQDTSLLRCKLIQKIVNTSNSKVMVVGDDFQSIYRFSGCNLDIFLNFHKYFPNPKKLPIFNTYRNAQETIDVAGNFIMKNKRQLNKILLSKKHLEKPIKIIYYENQKDSFKNLLLYLFKINITEILILGRNNNDIKKVIDNEFKIENDLIVFKNIKMKYLTVHRSKGLEEENVIIINLENNITGFPSKLEDDNILKYIVDYDDKIPYEEERRLFYVAITRTKNYTYLLTNKRKPSLFVKEIINEHKNNIEFLSIN
jgi:Superfamily I DNA and RNA helicases